MKTKNLFLLAALAVSGILHAESVDIPVLYRNPAEEVKTGQLQSFGFYENETRIVLAFQIKDLKKAMAELWDGVKAGDDDVVSAYLQNIARVARESAAAWVRVAAIAEKAGDEL